uniref:UBZ1-type domain-containing protein n=1 Tax=Triatoma infestans TaxID=30076 RepID=A0A023F5A3_TRIIF
MNSEVNNISNHSVKQNSSEKTTEFIPAASHYALKLAFQSIKERYVKLQDRLCALEEENVRFKENGNDKQFHNGSGCSRMEILEKKIDELSRQKAQLSHHIFMLANENKDLWNNLSKLTEEKQILVNQLRDLIAKTDSEKKQEEKPNSPASLQENIEAPIETVNIPEDLLKEFSTSDEDNKESLQSLETIKDFSLVQFENQFDLIDGLNAELKEILKKMNEDKVVLQQQQAGLKEALSTMRRMYQGMKMYIMYLKNLKTDKDSSLPETRVDCDSNKSETINESVNTEEKVNVCEQFENNDDITVNEEMICPFCGKLFVNSTLAEAYSKHFINHVKDCSNNSLVFRFT